MSDALKAREALARLRENLASFDAEVAYELASGGERADLWGEIDVNVEDLRAALSALDLSAIGAEGWREITEEDRPPNDTEVLMGCWESWPRQAWIVEYGLYGSTKGGWIHGRMTHWLPSSILPSPPEPRS